MALSIQYRGPDDAGVWASHSDGIALAHRRLSIIDLSAAGHQPMHSVSGRYVLVFNGEIYNHLNMRAELQRINAAPVWRGHSDTETLLEAIELWGLETTLKKTVGMFAIALWDTQEKILHLARDRFGEKPLYYGWVGNGDNSVFVFASELKAIRAYPGFANPICRDALAQYMRFVYVPAPYSIYQHIFKLEPGCLLSIVDKPPAAPSKLLRPFVKYDTLSIRRWWSLANVVESGAKQLFTDETEALKVLEHHLQDAVRLQSLADVPLGAFLSGGVDSSVIVALIQQQSSRPVKTFTVGFETAGFDESPHAKAIAQHLGTEHAELFVTALEAQAVIPHLYKIYDEPFADSSQIPAYLICRVARQQLTVALSGDAGDELFGGYNRYFWGPKLWKYLQNVPYPVRQKLVKVMLKIPRWYLPKLFDWLNKGTGKQVNLVRMDEKIGRLLVRLEGLRTIDDFYLKLVSEWQDPAQVVKGESGLSMGLYSMLEDSLPDAGVEQDALWMMYRDSMSYLPDDILCKMDRAAMSNSLETRIPFLDHRVAEVAWRLPHAMKIRGETGKWALKQVLYRYVPQELIDRPKAGFAIPIGEWLRGALRDWAESLLDEDRLKREGYFYPAPILAKWHEHLQGKRDHTASLWAVLMFQEWLENTQ